ncbi:MAG: hypothetical protein C0483_01085 [Pirellula sp.]|nr:hypothetical protein [Pirellula sp.]
MMRLAIALFVLATTVLAGNGVAVAQVPTLTHTSPYAVVPGKTTDVTFNGDGMLDALSMWTNIPGAEARLVPQPAGKGDSAPNPKKAKFNVTVPATAVPGIYGVRVTTKAGATNLRLITVDDLPTIGEETTNKTVAQAQSLKLPIAVDGVAEPETYDFFKFGAEAGQRVSIEVVARRMGSTLDPVVRLLDAAGHELAYADDDESTGPDGRLSYRIQKSGEYFIELRDIRYAGGSSYRYHLRIGDFPLLATPYPIGVQTGTTSLVEAVGYDVGALAPLRTAVPADFSGKQLPLAARYDRGHGSGFTLLAVAPSAEQTESEPNGARENASPLTLSGAINGRFEKPKDRDCFQLEGKKGTRFRFVGRTRGFGSPTDLFLRMYDKDGKTVAEAEDAGLEEGVLDYAFAADSAYYLAVEDLLGRGGPQFTYRIEIEPYQPSFALAIDVAKFDVPHGGVAKGKVTATRVGFTGPITLRADFLSEAQGITATGTIPEGKNDGVLTITVPKSVPQGAVVDVRIVGEGSVDKEGKQKLTAVAAATVPLRTLLGGLANPPLDLVERLPISVAPPVADFLKLTTSTKTVVLPQLVGKATLAVKVEKLNKFDAPVKLAVEGLPNGVSAKVGEIEKGKNETTIEFSASRTAAALDQTFRLTASAVLVDQPKSYVVEDLTLRIAPAVEAQVTAPAALVPGTKQTVKIEITRHAKAAPITLSWTSLPKGVAGGKDWTIAADQKSGTAELTVDAKAPLGPGVGRLTATTDVEGRKASIDLGMVELVVAPQTAPTAAKPADKKPAAKEAAPKQTADKKEADKQTAGK